MEQNTHSDPLATRTRKRLMLVVNPIASSVDDRRRRIVRRALDSRFEVVERVTTARGDASKFAGEAAAGGFDAVIAYGGDGTANEVANGLFGSDVPLGVLPGGSANVWCGVTGIPRDISGAVKRLLAQADEWKTRRVDTGSVNGNLFLFTSGAGLDAAVLEGVDARPDLKRRWRQWWFVTEATRKLAADYRFSPPKLGFRGPGKADGIAVVVQNGRPWTYFGGRPITVSRSADVGSGMLSATVVSRPRPWDYPAIVWRAFAGRGAKGHPRLTVHDDTNFTVEPLEGQLLDVHVDGDHIGRFERAVYEVEPEALSVLS